VRKGFNDKLKGNREKEWRKRLRISGVYTGELLFAFAFRCCAANLKVAGSKSVGVSGFLLT
jgi:hypothetical protein